MRTLTLHVIDARGRLLCGRDDPAASGMSIATAIGFARFGVLGRELVCIDCAAEVRRLREGNGEAA